MVEVIVGLLLAAAGAWIIGRWLPDRFDLYRRTEELVGAEHVAELWTEQLEQPLPPGVTLERALELADRRRITLHEAAMLLHRDHVRARTVGLVRRRRFAERFATTHPNLSDRLHHHPEES